MKVSMLNMGCIKENALLDSLRSKLVRLGVEFTSSLEESDYFVYITCAGCGKSFQNVYEDLQALNGYAEKRDIKIIVVGCLVTNFKALLEPLESNPNIKLIADKEWVIPAVNYIGDMRKRNTWKEKLYNRTYHFDKNNINIEFMLQEGCSNRCTFCKVHYVDLQLSSVPFEIALNYLKDMVQNHGTKIIRLGGDNLTLYGVDLYGTKRLHEFLHELSKTEGLEMIRVNELTAGDMYPELLDEITSNPKIVSATLQLETASDRLLKLMNRNYSIEEYDYYVKRIIESGKYVDTVLMSGFPTETQEDMDYTIRYLGDRRIIVGKICEYSDFKGVIPSSRLEQLSYREKLAHTRYMEMAKWRMNCDLFSEEMHKQDRLIYAGDVGNIHIFDNPISNITTISKSSRFDGLTPGSIILEPPRRLAKYSKYAPGMVYKI